MSEVARDVGQTVKARRVEKGLSQRELAHLMSEAGYKWHQTTVTKTEAGTRPIQLDEVVGLALILNLPSLNSILGGDSRIPGWLRELAEADRGRARAMSDTLRRIFDGADR